ncbi:MAG: type VI secretion system-associated FHA domain protein TagH [Vicinamibacterales bacterium]
MTLTFEISASSVGPIGTARHVFQEEGGTIGRAEGSTWMLPNRTVSAQHAEISWKDGVFYIRDTSRNGLSVNSPDFVVAPNRPYPLKTGDRIFIEPYEIRVSVDVGPGLDDRSSFAQTPDDFLFDDPFGSAHQRSESAQAPAMPAIGPLSEAVGNDELDPLKFLDPVPGSRPARGRKRPAPSPDDLLNAQYRPPTAVPDSAIAAAATGPIPEGYNPLPPHDFSAEPVPGPLIPRTGRDSGVGRRTSPSPKTPGATHRDSTPAVGIPVAATPKPLPQEPVPPVAGLASDGTRDVDFAELLISAGIPEAVISPGVAKTLGRIIRTVVVGLMDVLRSRQRIKEELNMAHTLFRPQDNNPLKFSANVEDALYNLLVKQNPAYLNPDDAFADAFDDVRDHELAMLAAMRAAFEAMLAEFEPDRLQQEFERQLGKSALPLTFAKLRYWDLYRERAAEMAKDPGSTFSQLFGERFKRVYDEQFRELKAQRRTRASADGPGPAEL